MIRPDWCAAYLAALDESNGLRAVAASRANVQRRDVGRREFIDEEFRRDIEAVFARIGERSLLGLCPTWVCDLVHSYNGGDFRQTLRAFVDLPPNWRSELKRYPRMRTALRRRRREFCRLLPSGERSSPEVRVEFGRDRARERVGVYFLFDGDLLVYVGKSLQWSRRLGDHRKRKRFTEAVLAVCAPHLIAPTEAAMIRHFLPPMNRSFPRVSCAEAAGLIENFRAEHPDLWRKCTGRALARCA